MWGPVSMVLTVDVARALSSSASGLAMGALIHLGLFRASACFLPARAAHFCWLWLFPPAVPSTFQ